MPDESSDWPGSERWWRKLKPIHKDDGEGQVMAWTYARWNHAEGDWEYVIVRFSDGDGPVEGLRETTHLMGGRIECCEWE